MGHGRTGFDTDDSKHKNDPTHAQDQDQHSEAPGLTRLEIPAQASRHFQQIKALTLFVEASHGGEVGLVFRRGLGEVVLVFWGTRTVMSCSKPMCVTNLVMQHAQYPEYKRRAH